MPRRGAKQLQTIVLVVSDLVVQAGPCSWFFWKRPLAA